MRTGGISVITVLVLWAAAGSSEEVIRIRAIYTEQAVPITPTAEAWQLAPEEQVKLSAQKILPPYGGGGVPSVLVRAVHDGQQLALRFEWIDATANQEVGSNHFRDSIAVGFPTRESERMPSPYMGDVEIPINIWQWTADFDANARGHGGFAKRYPHYEGVWYFPQDYTVRRDVRAWRGTQPVIELVAMGWGTLERKVSQNVFGVSSYADGRWRVVLRRALSTGNPEDTLFRPGETTQMILAVWDGENEEVNGRKNITMMWTPLTLDSTRREER